MADIDFKGLAAAALACAESLLLKWLPDGKLSENRKEFKAKNPCRIDNHKGSFSVNVETGKWGDFASDAAGLDLVSLCAYLRHDGNQVDAAKELAAELNMPDAVPPLERTSQTRKNPVPPAAASRDKPPAEKTRKVADDKGEWIPILPVPEDAPEPPRAHEFRGLPIKVWTYRSRSGKVLGYIARFQNSTGGKEIVPLSFCEHSRTKKREWRWISFPRPRPLYGLEKLDAYPDATVVVFEGEKCADFAQADLDPAQWISVTWPGGCKAVDHSCFDDLDGRNVITWADCDSKREKLSKAQVEAGMNPDEQPYLPQDKQPGYAAMARIREKLFAIGCSVRDVQIPAVGTVADGLDIADEIAAGATPEQIVERLQAAVVCDPPAMDANGPPPSDAPPPEETKPDDWYSQLFLTDKGRISPVTANVFDVLNNDRRWSGVIAWDEHAQCVVKLKPPPYANSQEGEWGDQDDTQTAMWMTRRYHFAPTSQTVLEAVETLAKTRPFHPVRDYLFGLPQWDGTKRIGSWIERCFGVVPVSDAQQQYLRLVSGWFLMGMVYRALEPGYKFDYCLVLEGTQGLRKSTALEVLAGAAWFGDGELDLQNKDAMVSLQGKWLHEFQEMGSIARSEEKRQKSFLSRRYDEFRPHYGRRNVKLARQLVFAGTTNEWEWNKDPTGGRRFWPVMVASVDIEWLREHRDLLFAEALAYCRAGVRCYPTKEEQRDFFDPEQLTREIADSFVDGLHDWVFQQVAPFSAYTAMVEGLHLDAAKQSRDVQTRVGMVLRKLGCRKFEKRNGMVRFWYEPPPRETKANTESGSSAPRATSETGGKHVPF